MPAPRERVDRFEEAVDLITRLMGQASTTVEGRHYRLEDARLRPPPIQRPRIPIVIAAHRPRMLRIAARYADQWDTFAPMPGTATEGVEAELAPSLGFTDFSTVAPASADVAVLRAIAADVIPALRTGRLLD